MKKNIPYFMTTLDNFPYKAYLIYDWKNRKTEQLIFMGGINLPAPDIGGMKYSQDPSTYDLIFESEVPENYLINFDVLPNTVGFWIVSKRCLKLLLDLCPDDFQYFPTIIRNKNDKIEAFENHDYVLINIAVTVDAVDYDQCTLRYSEQGILENEESVILKDGGMDGHHLARLKQFTPFELASPELVKIFKKEKIKGIKFTQR